MMQPLDLKTLSKLQIYRVYLSTLLIYGLFATTHQTVCSQNIDLSTWSQCTTSGTPQMITAANFTNWPSGGTYHLSFTFSLTITNNCPPVSPLSVEFIKISDLSSLVQMSIYYDYSNNVISAQSQCGSSEGQTLTLLSPTYPAAGDIFEFAASINLAGKTITVMGASSTATNTVTMNMAQCLGLSLHPPVTQINLCNGYISNSNGYATTLSCDIPDFVLWYDSPAATKAYLLGGVMNTVQIGSYGFIDGSLSNAAGSMGPAYLGNSLSSPTYLAIPEYAYSFNSSSQYITLPHFTPLPSNSLSSASFSVNMWVKLNTMPSSEAHIFSILSSDSSTQKFVLVVNGSGNLGFVISGSNSLFPADAVQLVLSTWTQLYFGLNLRTSSQVDCALYTETDFMMLTHTSPVLAFSSSDIVLIGGTPTFIGEVSSVMIMSPGTLLLLGSCESYAVSQIGVGASSILLTCVPGTYMSNGRCMACSPQYLNYVLPQQTQCVGCISPCYMCSNQTACLACEQNHYYNPAEFTCTPCSPGTYTEQGDSAPSCISCTNGCDVCDANFCTVCFPGYTLTGGGTCERCTSPCITCLGSTTYCLSCQPQTYLNIDQCVGASSCPSSTYANSTTWTCEDCPSACNTCVNSSYCASCLNPKYLYDGQCIDASSCPAATYADFSSLTCANCASGCLQCVNVSFCTICESSYYLHNAQCVDASSCPPTTYANSSTGTCSGCVSPCNYCSGYSTCLSCQSDLYLYNAQCFTASLCPDSTYANSTTHTCVPTKYICGTDRVGIDYYYLDSGICGIGCSYPYVVEQVTGCRIDLSPSDNAIVNHVSTTTTIAETTMSFAKFIASLVMMGDPGAFGVIGLTKMVYYTRYMDILYPPKLQKVFILQSVNNTVIPLINSYQNWLAQSTPRLPISDNFAQYWLHSSFLVNYFQSLVCIGIILGLMSVLWLLTLATRRWQTIHLSVSKMHTTIQWNLLFSYMLSEYDGVILYTSLDIRTNHPTSPPLALSLTALLLMNILVIVILFTSISVVRKQREDLIKAQIEAVSYQDQIVLTKGIYRYSSVFESFKQGRWSQRSFFPLYTVRICIFHFVIAYLYEYPLPQAIIILSLNILTLMYLCIERPMTHMINNIFYIITELALVVINAGVLTIAILDYREYIDLDFRAVVGDVILGCNVLLRVLSVVIIILRVGLEVYIIIKARKSAALREAAAGARDRNAAVLNQTASVNIEQDGKNNASSIIAGDQSVSMIQGSSSVIGLLNPGHDHSHKHTLKIKVPKRSSSPHKNDSTYNFRDKRDWSRNIDERSAGWKNNHTEKEAKKSQEKLKSIQTMKDEGKRDYKSSKSKIVQGRTVEAKSLANTSIKTRLRNKSNIDSSLLPPDLRGRDHRSRQPEADSSVKNKQQMLKLMSNNVPDQTPTVQFASFADYKLNPSSYAEKKGPRTPTKLEKGIRSLGFATDLQNYFKNRDISELIAGVEMDRTLARKEKEAAGQKAKKEKGHEKKKNGKL